MADDNEEDLFADLYVDLDGSTYAISTPGMITDTLIRYDNDEPIAPKQEPPPAAATATALPEVATDSTTVAPDTLQNGNTSIPMAVGDGHTQNPGAQVAPWENTESNEDVGTGGDAPAAEEHRPIGIKEDG